MLLFAYYPKADERNINVGVAIANECPANPRWSRPRKAIALGLTVAANICWVAYRGAATQHLCYAALDPYNLQEDMLLKEM
jgi:hypothetical protein